MSNLAGPPAETSAVLPTKGVAGRTDYLVTSVWFIWLSSLVTRLQSVSQVLDVVTTTAAQGTAAISTTPIPLPTIAAGLYRISWYARITQAASVSSSLTVTIGWTESGIALTLSGAAITANTTTTVQSGVITIQVDASTPITYATTYVSVGAPAMTYSLRVIAELVS